MKRRTLVLGGVSAGIGLPFAASAARVGSWPDHEIKVILPVSAGGANDLLARSVFDYVGKSLNTTFVILNSPGGGAVRGTILLAKSKPDGYTVGNVSYSGLLLTPHTVEVSYTLSDFDMLGSAGEPLYGVAVNSNSPVETMADLVALAKKRPVTVSSNTIVNMVCMFQLATKTGASFQWIPTRTETEAVMLAGGGEVDCVVQSAPEITSGVADRQAEDDCLCQQRSVAEQTGNQDDHGARLRRREQRSTRLRRPGGLGSGNQVSPSG